MKKGFKKRADGSLEYRFTVEHMRYSVYGKTIKECEDKAFEKKTAILANQYTKNKDITISKYIDEWLKQRMGTVKISTGLNQRRMLDNVSDKIGKVKVKDLERRQVIDLQQELAKKLSTSGTNNHISLLRTIMNSAIADRIIQFNPCDNVKPLKRKESETLARDTNHRALTLEEQEQFFSYAKDFWYYEMFAFLVSTGMRIGEASALTWNDIDYRNEVIHITKTITKITDNDYTIGSPKTKTSVRDIPLTESVKDILKQQKEKTTALFGSKVIDINGRIFKAQRTDNYITASTLGSNLKAIFEAMRKDGIEFEYFSAHAFRDTFATRCIEQGMQPQTLKAILGHSSLSMTMDLYAHVLPNTKAEEMKVISIAI